MMQDAIGNDLAVGDYVAVVLGDWVNNQHLGRVIGGGSRMIDVSLKIYENPECTRLVQVNCVVKVDRDVAIRYILSKSD